MAAAVLFDLERLTLADRRALSRLNDSKQHNEAAREELYPLVMRAAARTAIVSRCVRGIDQRGLHVTNLDALRSALLRVARPGTICLVDGFEVPALEHEQRAVIDGDCRSAAIAAASVLAKVTRDRYMRRAAERHPEWDFATNVGYSTPEHRAAIAEHGVSPLHRMSFQSIAYTQLAAASGACAAAPSPCTAAGRRRTRQTRPPRRCASASVLAARATGAGRVTVTPIASKRISGRRGWSPARPVSHSRASRRRRRRFAVPMASSGPGAPAGTGHAGLHLAEDERASVRDHQVELAGGAAEVALDDRVAGSLEVLARQPLAQRAECARVSGCARFMAADARRGRADACATRVTISRSPAAVKRRAIGTDGTRPSRGRQ